jgi:hypothetical protein
MRAGAHGIHKCNHTFLPLVVVLKMGLYILYHMDIGGSSHVVIGGV